jgi:protein subunit release factor A
MKELLFSVTKKDFEISYFSGTGAGGQHRNRHMNCVRIRHPESGATAVGQDEKSKKRNLQKAFKRLTSTSTFTVWLNRRIHEATIDREAQQREIERAVERAMAEENLKVEYYTPAS